jgi:hypothetical protein
MMDRQTKYAVSVFCVIVLLVLIMAAYGYWTGAWDSELSPP